MNVRAFAVPASLLITVATGAQECDEGGSPPPGRVNACGMEPEVRVEAPLVVASVKAACDPAPEIHDLELDLELLDEDGEWKNAGHRRTTEIPAPGLPPVTLEIRHMCVEATWRASAKATGVIGADNNFQFKDQATRWVTWDDCRRQ